MESLIIWAVIFILGFLFTTTLYIFFTKRAIPNPEEMEGFINATRGKFKSPEDTFFVVKSDERVA
ncbi:MAG: hypothetical protein KTR26_04115 [Flammeovirgaceae bacterium]|nr:hypothetical protein [Flammeovirgaceae bacterium]